jgi:stearoyl-CoA desaturase (delta-9 desaturase)
MVNLVSIGFILSYHIVALYGIFNVIPNPISLYITLALSKFNLFGITMGYHRLWSHKSFEAHPLLKMILAFAGAGASQGSIIWWSRLHRLHHRKSDTEDDPYGPQKGFLYSHIWWIFEDRKIKALKNVNINDLKNDPIVAFQHKYYVIMSLSCSILLPIILYSLFDNVSNNLLMLICYPISLTRIYVWHSTWFVNSLAHWLGKQSYGKSGTSKDHIFTAILTLGEGYHNFHHEFPYDYRNAIKWYQYDPTKWLILLCEYMNLVYNKKFVDDKIIQMNSNDINGIQNIEDIIYPNMTYEEYSKTDNLLIYEGYIYDMTDFMDKHPGGKSYIKNSCGKFDDYVKINMNILNNHSNGAMNLLKTFKVAKLI